MGVSYTVPTYWYISFMFFWYIVFFLIIRVRGAYDLRYWILGIASVTVFLLGNSLQAEQALSFFFGVLISDHQEYAENKMTNSKFQLFLLILGCCFLGLKQVPVIRNLQGTYIWYVLQLVMKISLALVIIGATQKYQEVVTNKFIFLMGAISYEFYLIHFRLLELPVKGILGMVNFLIGSMALSLILNIITIKIKELIMKKH